MSREKYPELCRLWELFVDAKDYGSILKVDGFDFERLVNEVDSLKRDKTLDSVFIGSKVEQLVQQARLMRRKYDCVITNPPYMGLRGMNSKLADFIKIKYPDSKGDLFAVFIEKSLDITRNKGFTSMITMQSWMFLSSFEKLRNSILEINRIITLSHLENMVMGIAFGTSAFILQKDYSSNESGVYFKVKLKDLNPNRELESLGTCLKYIANSNDFSKIPGSPIAYWISEKIRNVFESSQSLGSIADTRLGMATADNNKFLRYWNEIRYDKIGFNFSNRDDAKDSKNKWFPYNKGGYYRKWYGNNEYLVNWENDGSEIKNYKDKNGKVRSHNYNLKYIFKTGISWSALSSGNFGARWTDNGFLFDNAGSSLFSKVNSKYLLFILNSKKTMDFLRLINPTMNYQPGNLNGIPIIFPESKLIKQQIDPLIQKCINISKEEWDSRETSWDFTTNELLRYKTTDIIEDAYNNYCTYWKDQFFKLHANEEELNRIFIDIYDLSDELTPDVPLKDITILKEESEIKKDKLVFKKETIIKHFISYAVGCMLGRYSPDREGLILANQGEIIDDVMEKVPDASFMPDDDNIIPILEDEYFTDDIVGRFKEFLKVTFGAETLAENLEFIAGGLSKSKKGSESSEKTIRDYFLKSFFKDHTKMYKKRPIYWLFTSGKGGGFNALVYMHRYNNETLTRMRIDYLLELESKLEAKVNMLTSDSAKVTQEKAKLRAQIDELAAYDVKLNDKALVYIDIDLDDGVVMNYAKFEGLVGKV